MSYKLLPCLINRNCTRRLGKKLQWPVGILFVIGTVAASALKKYPTLKNFALLQRTPDVLWLLGGIGLLVLIVLWVLGWNPVWSWMTRLALVAFKKSVRESGAYDDFVRVVAREDNLKEWMATTGQLADWQSLVSVVGSEAWSAGIFDPLTKDVWELRLQNEQIKQSLRTVKSCDRVDQKRSLSQALEILQRYNSAWTAKHLSYRGDLPEYIKGISNPFAEEVVRNALQHPFLYRLNFIKQLGTCCQQANLDASHHRLPHALGTAEAAALILEAITRELEHNPCDHVSDLRLEEKKAVVLHALTHDCGHGPLGHTLDPLGSVLLPEGAGRLDKRLMVRYLQPDGEVAGLVRTVAGENEAPTIVELMLFLVKRDENRPDYCSKYYLTEIINSTVDADRFDYILRDALHLGQPRFDKNRWIDVLMSARAVWEPQQAGLPEELRRRMIAFPKRYKDRIDELLTLRRRLYTEYYESEEKLAIDEMICHIIYYCLDKAGLLSVASEERETQRLLFEKFLKLTDADLFPFLAELAALMESDTDIPARQMIRDVLTNRHYKPITRYGIPAEKAGAIIAEAKKLSKAMDKEKEKHILRQTAYPPGLSEEDARLKRLKEVYTNEQISSEAQLLHFARLMYSSFDDKWEFEKNLWASLLRNKEIENAWWKVCERTYGSEACILKEVLQGVPHVHIAIPSFVGNVTKGRLDQYDSDYSDVPQDRSDPLESKVLCYDDNGKAEWVKPQISYPGDTYVHHDIFLSVHFDLSGQPGLKELVEQEFMKQVESLGWLLREPPAI